MRALRTAVVGLVAGGLIWGLGAGVAPGAGAQTLGIRPGVVPVGQVPAAKKPPKDEKSTSAAAKKAAAKKAAAKKAAAKKAAAKKKHLTKKQRAALAKAKAAKAKALAKARAEARARAIAAAKARAAKAQGEAAATVARAQATTTVPPVDEAQRIPRELAFANGEGVAKDGKGFMMSLYQGASYVPADEATRACIMERESHTTYTSGRHGRFKGAYQFSSGLARGVTYMMAREVKVQFGQPGLAMLAALRTKPMNTWNRYWQDRAFWTVWNHGRGKGNWRGGSVACF